VPLDDPLAIAPLSAPPDTTVALPGSKSITNRALICAALARGTSRLTGLLLADDTRAMLDVLHSAGIGIDLSEQIAEATIAGCNGEPVGDGSTWFANQSGTTGRFAVPLAALARTALVVDGDPQLRSRPMADQFVALRTLGVTVDAFEREGYLPARVTGPITGDRVALPGDSSSQFISGLMMAGAVGGMTIELTTEAVSRPYIDMTAAVMKSFGATVETLDGRRWSVSGGYRGTDYAIEPDASAASYFMAAAAITGGRVRIEGLGSASMQGDVGFASVLEAMGCRIEMGPDWLEVSGRASRGVAVDMSDISDTAPTLAVVAALAESPTSVSGIGFIRDKESDRIAGPVAELNRCGVPAREVDDGFVIEPHGRPGAAVFETYDDHRMAMSLSLIGLVTPGVAIRNPACVNKTFPDYFSALDQLR